MTMPRRFEGYEENNNDNNTSALLTFILGAAAGVAAGMLLAPFSGQESRRKIADTANGLAGKAGDWANQAGTQLNDLKANASSTINKVVEKAEQMTGKANDQNSGNATNSANQSGNI